MNKYIKLEDALNVYRLKPIIKNGTTTGVRYPTPEETMNDLSELPTIEVSEDCISREWVLEEFENGKEKISKSEYFDELMWLVKHAPSVVPSGTNVECYARNCEKNKNGKCEETDIILEFGCGD